MSTIQAVSAKFASKRFAAHFACTLLGILIVYPISGRTDDYLPLDIGNQWYYESDLGETQLMTIIGEATILGAVTRVHDGFPVAKTKTDAHGEVGSAHHPVQLFLRRGSGHNGVTLRK